MKVDIVMKSATSEHKVTRAHQLPNKEASLDELMRRDDQCN